MRGLLTELGFQHLIGEPRLHPSQVVDKTHSAYFDVTPPKFTTIRLAFRISVMGISKRVTSQLVSSIIVFGIELLVGRLDCAIVKPVRWWQMGLQRL